MYNDARGSVASKISMNCMALRVRLLNMFVNTRSITGQDNRVFWVINDGEWGSRSPTEIFVRVTAPFPPPKFNYD